MNYSTLTKAQFQIGVNEYGLHFREPVTGVIITLKKATGTCLRMAISSCKDNKEEKCIREWLEKNAEGVHIKYVDKLPLEKCYISRQQGLFEWVGMYADGIGLKHIKTGKEIGISNVIAGIPEVVFALKNQTGCHQAVKDFFELCSSKISHIYAGTQYRQIYIPRTSGLRNIKRNLLYALSNGIKESCFKKALESNISYDKDTQKVTIVINAWKILANKVEEERWSINANEETKPILGLVFAIEAVKKFPQVDNLCYRYKFDGHQEKVYITQNNKETILTKTIREGRISLTV